MLAPTPVVTAIFKSFPFVRLFNVATLPSIVKLASLFSPTMTPVSTATVSVPVILTLPNLLTASVIPYPLSVVGVPVNEFHVPSNIVGVFERLL